VDNPARATLPLWKFISGSDYTHPHKQNPNHS
jgi:hypothetical protein